MLTWRWPRKPQCLHNGRPPHIAGLLVFCQPHSRLRVVAISMLADRTRKHQSNFYLLFPFSVTPLFYWSIYNVQCYPNSPISGEQVAHAQAVDTRPIFRRSAAWDRGQVQVHVCYAVPLLHVGKVKLVHILLAGIDTTVVTIRVISTCVARRQVILCGERIHTTCNRVNTLFQTN